MHKYVRLTKHLTRVFDNMMADEVSKLASSEEGGINMGLEMEVQKYPSIEEVPTFAIQSIKS